MDDTIVPCPFRSVIGLRLSAPNHVCSRASSSGRSEPELLVQAFEVAAICAQLSSDRRGGAATRVKDDEIASSRFCRGCGGNLQRGASRNGGGADVSVVWSDRRVIDACRGDDRAGDRGRSDGKSQHWSAPEAVWNGG